MKLTTKYSLLAAVFAAIAANAAFGDDQQLQNRNAINRAQNPSSRETTVALFPNGRSLGSSDIKEYGQRPEARLETRTDGHGRSVNFWVEAK